MKKIKEGNFLLFQILFRFFITLRIFRVSDVDQLSRFLGFLCWISSFRFGPFVVRGPSLKKYVGRVLLIGPISHITFKRNQWPKIESELRGPTQVRLSSLFQADLGFMAEVKGLFDNSI